MDGNELVLGIDGGGTKTVVWLAPVAGNTILGRGSSGPSNPQALGFQTACRSLDQAIQAAFDDAKLETACVASACLALAGVDRENDRRHIETWAAKRRLARNFQVVHDALPVLAAGTPNGWGVALIAGTGSLGFGCSADGRSARSGGWGYLFGDEGSGYAIALAALRAAAQAADGRGPQTRLLDRLLTALNLRNPDELISAIYPERADRPSIAALAEPVLQTAADGDAVALQIITGAADDLAAMVAVLVRKLDFNPQAFPLALAGGVLLQSPLMRQRLGEALVRQQLTAGPMNTVAEPVAGAVVLARKHWLGEFG
jgi:N-acetylmuramic acid 6-phosphate etherase